MSDNPSGRRVIDVGKKIPAPDEPRLRTVRERRLSDYPSLSQAHRDMVRVYSSPLLMGPPICDELVALVSHLFTEEEAAAVRHLGLVKGRTAAQVARAEHRPVDEVQPILHRLAFDLRAIVADGRDHNARYRLLPILPGVFEMVLVTYTPETLTAWHRRFIELFEALYETGYGLDYAGVSSTLVRVLPVSRAIEAHPMALPTDQLAAIMDRFDHFAVGQCQCRTTARALGRGCDRPLGNCMAMGKWARNAAKQGWMRAVSKQEALEIKREAESLGLVNWMLNVEPSKSQCSCSCCGCCCHAMRQIGEFSAPSLFAPPHFLPRLDLGKCVYCGRCATKCPVRAIVVDRDAKTYRHLPERCIGCGLCAVACDSRQAIAMQPVPRHRLPYRSWFAATAASLPGAIRTAWRVWRSRR